MAKKALCEAFNVVFNVFPELKQGIYFISYCK